MKDKVIEYAWWIFPILMMAFFPILKGILLALGY